MEKKADSTFNGGIGLGLLIGTLIGVSITCWAFHITHPKSPPKKFEVVDKYDNRCNVIQYTPDNSARYFYFLDCSSK